MTDREFLHQLRRGIGSAIIELKQNEKMLIILRHIYSKHRSSTCGDVLIHAYKNGECSYCRSKIVIAMAKSDVLPDKILFECQYDSYDETRRYAQRLMKRRKYSLTN